MFLVSHCVYAATVDGTVQAGARTSPESAIQVPSAWEGEFEPSALVYADVRARFGKTAGPWARLELGGWGYAPDLDASLALGGVGVGWGGAVGPADVSLAGRYDGQWFPLLNVATNGRAEVIARARYDAKAWGISGQFTGVDRRFVGATGFTTGELGVVASLTPAPAFAVDVGASGQANHGVGPVGGQLRTIERVRVGAKAWRFALEHRFVWALEGESEEETRPAFTPVGDYADDVDALSGGGFVQHRFSASGVVTAGKWTVTAGGFGRFRSAEEEEEEEVAFVRSFGGQARVQRTLSPAVELFGAGGAVGATRGSGQGFVDGFGWVGVELHAAPKPKPAPVSTP